MADQSSFPRNTTHPREYYSSHAPMHPLDSGHLYQSTRGMGLPSMDFPPQPVEIELSNSRTLPSPSASAAVHWDLSQHGFGEMPSSYSSNPSRHFLVENQSRASSQAPLLQWYEENDGPWVPKGVIPTKRNPRPKIGNRMSGHYNLQYRQPRSMDSGLYPFGTPNSDSGYGSNGARRSDGNASIFSADLTDRDQDSRSISGPPAEFHSYPCLNEVTSDIPRNGSWSSLPSTSLLGSTASLVCPTCHKTVKTRSELKKHDLRHTRPFHCTHPGCTRSEGFSTTNDLERHTKSKHPTALQGIVSTIRYRCRVPGCKSSEKSWPRLDNFKSHLKRVHHLIRDEDFENILRDAEFDPMDQNRITSQRSGSVETSPQSLDTDGNGLYIQTNQSQSKPVYPDVISADVLDSKLSTPKEDTNKDTLSEDKDAIHNPPLAIVEPVEVFAAQPENAESRLALVNILAPVSYNVPELKPKDICAVPQITTIKPRSEGKAIRKQSTASDAKLTEVIKNALVGAKQLPDINDRNLHHDVDRNGVPARVSSPNSQWSAEPISAASSIHITSALPPSLKEDDEELEAKAKDVLKSLRDSGYTIQEPSPQKRLNQGSAASNKSEHLVICPSCSKFKGRPCELKKHMKRHSRPYGCTFANCNKDFGSKNDWKRHENSQHFHLETWRCIEKRPEGGVCAKVCYRRQTLQEHLKKDHSITADAIIKNKLDACRLGRNCQARFWCGFCSKLIDLTKKGLDAWTERYNHIDDHFMGRHGQLKQNIRDWIPVDSDKPRGDLPPFFNASPDNEVNEVSSPASSSSCESESSGAAVKSAHVRNPASHRETLKRKHSESSDDSRKAKKAMVAQKTNTVVYCCQCGSPHNPKLDQRCSMCPDSHTFCEHCIHEEDNTNKTSLN